MSKKPTLQCIYKWALIGIDKDSLFMKFLTDIVTKVLQHCNLCSKILRVWYILIYLETIIITFLEILKFHLSHHLYLIHCNQLHILFIKYRLDLIYFKKSRVKHLKKYYFLKCFTLDGFSPVQFPAYFRV